MDGTSGTSVGVEVGIQACIGTIVSIDSFVSRDCDYISVFFLVFVFDGFLMILCTFALDMFRAEVGFFLPARISSCIVFFRNLFGPVTSFVSFLLALIPSLELISRVLEMVLLSFIHFISTPSSLVMLNLSGTNLGMGRVSRNPCLTSHSNLVLVCLINLSVTWKSLSVNFLCEGRFVQSLKQDPRT